MLLSSERRATAVSTSAQPIASAAAGAGPRSAMARTIERNAPESSRPRIRNAEQLAAGGENEQEAEQRQRRPVFGTARQRGSRSRRGEDRAVDQSQAEAGLRHSPRSRQVARKPQCAPRPTARSDICELECFAVRRRLEPLRVRPFGRLLGSYTVNDLGDSIGVVALAVLVFDRTNSVAPTAGFFLVAKFLPALFATGLTARLDQLSLRRTLPAHLCARGARLRRARVLRLEGRFFLPRGARARHDRRDAGDHRTRAHARRRRRGAATARPDRGGQRADEPRLRGVLGVRRGARGPPDRGVRGLRRAARRRRLVPGDRGVADHGEGVPAPRAHRLSPVARPLPRRARRSRARIGSSGRC